MRKIIKIAVTKKDIEEGQIDRGPACETCAIALALRRRFKTSATEWAYHHGHVNGVRYEATARTRVHKWVEQHDRIRMGFGGIPQVQPFTLRIFKKAALTP